jgi:hypothetical protein
MDIVSEFSGAAWVRDPTLEVLGGTDVALDGGRGGKCTDSEEDRKGHQGGVELHAFNAYYFEFAKEI